MQAYVSPTRSFRVGGACRRGGGAVPSEVYRKIWGGGAYTSRWRQRGDEDDYRDVRVRIVPAGSEFRAGGDTVDWDSMRKEAEAATKAGWGVLKQELQMLIIETMSV